MVRLHQHAVRATLNCLGGVRGGEGLFTNWEKNAEFEHDKTTLFEFDDLISRILSFLEVHAKRK